MEENLKSGYGDSKDLGEGDRKIWNQVDEWFAKLDTNNDGHLDIAEVKPYVEEYLKKEFEIEPSDALIQDTFADLAADGGNVTKQGLHDHIAASAGVVKEAKPRKSAKGKQPVKKLTSKLDQRQVQKLPSV